MESPDISGEGVVAVTANEPTPKLRQLPLVLCFLFLVSGSSGLMYEVVWLRMLSRTLGSTIYAASTILAVFMGGLALGSFLFGRYADRVRRPLVLYAALEAGIGLTAVLSLGMNSWPVPLYHAIYSMTGDSRAALTIGQVILAMAALLLPTTLMGATLPTLCAYGVRRTASLGRVVGTLYALNTVGAMVGVLMGGFVLIGQIGETRTVLVGASINLLVAMLALALLPAFAANQSPDLVPVSAPPTPESPPDNQAATADSAVAVAASHRIRQTVLVCFGVSGFVSLAMEIVWSRMLPLYEGTSIYAFTSMLGVMLAGIGLGGWIGGFVERWKDPLLVLARLEMGVALALALGMASFALFNGTFIFVPPLVMVGPAALLLGIAFPVTVRCYTDHANIIGRRVGELYAWNTVGCILGSLVGGFLLMRFLGAAHSGAFLAAVAAMSAIALLAVHPQGLGRARLPDYALLVATLVTVVSIGDPYRDVIYTSLFALNPDMQIFDNAEEASATTTAGGVPADPLTRSLLVNGYGMTTLLTGNKLMAHLPLWLSDSPREALVICMGMGTTYRSATRHPDIDVTVVELVPAVTRFMHYYHPDAQKVMEQPNSHIVVDDGRNYMLMHPRQFDIITIDPAPPIYSAGTVNLYSREFFELCSSRIRPSGVVCLWVPPAPVSESKMVLRTFAKVFPNVSVWVGPTYAGFYLIGTLRPVNDIEARVRRGFADPAIVADLVEWDRSCDSPEKVLSLRICDGNELLSFTSDCQEVTDDHPYTEFPLFRLDGRHPENLQVLDGYYLYGWLHSHGLR